MSVDWMKVPERIADGYVRPERERDLKCVEVTVCICGRCGTVCKRHEVGVLVQGLGTIVSVRFATADESCSTCGEFRRPCPWGRGPATQDRTKEETFDWASRVWMFQDLLAAARQAETNKTIAGLEQKLKAIRSDVAALTSLVHSATRRC
jgi:hypothetical protein